MRKLTYLIVTALMLFIVGCGGGGSGTNLASLLPGHKYYVIDKKDIKFSDGTPAYDVVVIEFKNNGEAIAYKESNTTDVKKIKYKVEGNELILLDNNNSVKEKYTLVNKTGNSITLKKSGSGKTKTLYTSKTAALEAVNNDTDHDTDGSTNNDTNNDTDHDTDSSNGCQINGNTVLVDEGKTCSYGGHTAVCNNDYVTVDNTFTGKSVTLNGTTYTCN